MIMHLYLKLIFWTGTAALFYTYLGYPALLAFLSRCVPERKTEGGCEDKRVTLVVAAYNEEKTIGQKMENALGLDYPDGLLDVLVVSDGSTDKTLDIARSYARRHARVRLMDLPRGGKASAINAAMEVAEGEITIFSDANTELRRDAVKALVSHFSDDSIGCVCGRLIYRNPGGVVSGKGESFYWRYETALKIHESRLGYIAGANGAIYAIRKSLFKPLPPGTINDDFLISMRIVAMGYRSVYEERALAYEDVAPSVKSEFKRHIRDGAGHYRAMKELLGLANPLLGTRSLIYWSHRVLRWLAPFILFLLIFVNIILAGEPFFRGLLMLQTGFYGAAIAGFISSGLIRVPFIMYVPFYFCNLNLALLLGFVKAVTGAQNAAWERTEREG